MIIGLTGTLGAGKGAVAEILKKKGFSHYSARGLISEEVYKRGLVLNRESLVQVANDMRQRNSPSYIAEKLFEKAQAKGGNSIIESIRTVGEIEALRKKGNFFLVAVDASPAIRYQRIQNRKSETDFVSFEQFLREEQKEMTSEDTHKQNLKSCIENADVKIINNGSFEELEMDVEELLNVFGFKKEEAPVTQVSKEPVSEEIDSLNVKEKRPSWDEYFIGISQAVSKRATCDRGKSGCVIAKNKQILVTGYVGSPVGLSHCDEIGHQMKTTTHEDGSQTKHCVRTTHAEQNAICQAAKLGISIEGAALYCKMTPCIVCAKMIINSGIKRVVCEKKYHAGIESEKLFEDAKIQLEIIDSDVESYLDQ